MGSGITLPELFSVDIVAIAVVGFAVYKYAESQAPAIQTLLQKRAAGFVQTQTNLVAANAQSYYTAGKQVVNSAIGPWNPFSWF